MQHGCYVVRSSKVLAVHREFGNGLGFDALTLKAKEHLGAAFGEGTREVVRPQPSAFSLGTSDFLELSYSARAGVLESFELVCREQGILHQAFDVGDEMMTSFLVNAVAFGHVGAKGRRVADNSGFENVPGQGGVIFRQPDGLVQLINARVDKVQQTLVRQEPGVQSEWRRGTVLVVNVVESRNESSVVGPRFLSLEGDGGKGKCIVGEDVINASAGTRGVACWGPGVQMLVAVALRPRLGQVEPGGQVGKEPLRKIQWRGMSRGGQVVALIAQAEVEVAADNHRKGGLRFSVDDRMQVRGDDGFHFFEEPDAQGRVAAGRSVHVHEEGGDTMDGC